MTDLLLILIVIAVAPFVFVWGGIALTKLLAALWYAACIPWALLIVIGEAINGKPKPGDPGYYDDIKR